MYIISEWFPGNEVVNPALNAVLANTGAINKGGVTGTYCVFHFWVNSTVATKLLLGVYNAVDTLVQSFPILVPANQVVSFGSDTLGFQVPNNFRVKITAPAAIVGTVSASIIVGTFAAY